MLKIGIDVVAAVFGAFGGLLGAIAPPDQGGPAFTVGIAQGISVLVFLVVAAFIRGRVPSKVWLVIAVVFALVFVGSVYHYSNDWHQLTFVHPQTNSRYVCGSMELTQLTPEARAAIAANPNLDCAELVGGFGGIDYIHDVWPADVLEVTRRRLLLGYLVSVCSFSFAVFCLVELIPDRPKGAP
jgi:hypothetical protein